MLKNEPQANHVHALADSITFGRFISESSFGCEKWSSVPRKRYVEEAKSYTQPGSVAQKKAFFEAYYKKIAAQKAAAEALLEQEKAAAATTTCQVSDTIHTSETIKALLEQEKAAADTITTRQVSDTVHNSETIEALLEQEKAAAATAATTRQVSDTVHNSETIKALLEQEKAAAATTTSTGQVSDTVHSSETIEALLKQEKAAASTSRQVSDTVHDSETTKPSSRDILEAVLKSINLLPIDNNIVAANTKKTEPLNKTENLEDHVSVSVSVSDNSRTTETERPVLKSKSEEVTQPMIKRKPALSSLVSSVGRKSSKIPPSPSKHVASVNHGKDNISTPRTKNCVTNGCIDKKKTAAKSVKMLMSSSFVEEPCKKTQSTKPPSVQTTPKHGVTPMKTPAKAFVNELNKQPLATPSTVNTRKETPNHPTAGESKSTGPKWHVLSAVSKSLSGYKKKLQSPTIPSPFLFRTEDRAARRKQKLEEKFNEKEAQKLQQQTSFKEKADTEIRRLRQTYCFKARPLPDFYKGRETPKNQMKTPDEAIPKLFTPQRKAPSSNTSLANRKSSRRLWKNNDQNTAQHPFSSATGMMSHENTSPNILHLASKHTHSKRPT